MSTPLTLLLIAVFADLTLRDPHRIYHPVQAIGSTCSLFEGWLRTIIHQNLRYAGIGFVLMVLGFWTAIFYAIVLPISSDLILIVILTYLVYALLSWGSLTYEAKKVSAALNNHQYTNAREYAQRLVSRDISHETEQGVIRAVTESVTENLSDGIIAPLFYFAVGGPILMLLYKVVNTMDSMVGYTNKHYKKFGWAAARLDDLANFIPARITGILLIITAGILGDSMSNTIGAWRRDAQKGPSPNGGIPICCFAGAINITLGGPCQVDGQTVDIPTVGGARKILHASDITKAIQYTDISALGMLILVALII